jgi:hypothetical protein
VPGLGVGRREGISSLYLRGSRRQQGNAGRLRRSGNHVFQRNDTCPIQKPRPPLSFPSPKRDHLDMVRSTINKRCKNCQNSSNKSRPNNAFSDLGHGPFPKMAKQSVLPVCNLVSQNVGHVAPPHPRKLPDEGLIPGKNCRCLVKPFEVTMFDVRT